MNFFFKLFACPVCPVLREQLAFVQNELRQSQDRERLAVNVALAAQEKPLMHVERTVMTPEEQDRMRLTAEQMIEDAQAIFRDQGTDTQEKIQEV
jgi:hypothetical protein